MLIKTILTISCCLSSCFLFAFSDSTIAPKDFKNLTGCWSGTIMYLDYTSNKPFSMPAALIVKDFKKSSSITCELQYPKEPKANTTDTMLISKDGKFLNNEPVTDKKILGKDSILVVTETSGIDGNDNKRARIRHTYLLGKNSYSIKKEVLFTGQSQWILRNEYRFRRTLPCS